ncbi:MAG: GPP34 family phosphoprotein [Anaerolineae bacterium]|nr:GPP34 family phosphoprotein [Anaerolineae bacterium]
MFNLEEALFLLAINDDKGTIMGSIADYLPYGLAGAVLSELAIREKFTIDEKKHVILREGLLTGDPILDQVLEQMYASNRPRKVQTWINRLGTGKLVGQVADRLIEQSVLRREKKRFLWIVPYSTYPQQNTSAKYQIKSHLREAILAGETRDSRTGALLSLVRATRMLDLVFTRDECKAATRRIKDSIKGEVFGEAVAQVLQEIESAATVVVTTAATS